MKKLILIPVILVLILAVAFAVRKGYTIKEVKLTNGPVERVTSTETETILYINPNNSEPIVILDTNGAMKIKRAAKLERVVISQEGIKVNEGEMLKKWEGQIRYVPAQSFRVFSSAVHLGRLEMQTGVDQDFYISKP